MIVELGFPMVDLLWMHAKYHTFDREPSAGPNTSNSVELEEWLNKSARYYNRTEMLADVGVKSQLRGHKSGVEGSIRRRFLVISQVLSPSLVESISIAPRGSPPNRLEPGWLEQGKRKTGASCARKGPLQVRTCWPSCNL
jgi:hypothetical protein